MMPTAPPLLGPSAGDDTAPPPYEAPPSYDEVIPALSDGSFSSLSRLGGAGDDVPLQPSLSTGTAVRTDPEVGPAGPGQTDTAGTAPPPYTAGGTGDERFSSPEEMMSPLGHQADIPTAPPLLDPSVEDCTAPPSYTEARAAPSDHSFSNLSWLDNAGEDVLLQPSSSTGTSARADTEAGPAGPGRTDSTDTGERPPSPPPAAGGTGDALSGFHGPFGQIKDVKQKFSIIRDLIAKLLRKSLGCLLGIVAVAVVLALVLGLPVTLITVGAVYMTECPAISVWMVVLGVVLIVGTPLMLCTNEWCKWLWGIVGFLFYFTWFLAGCILIYPAWPPAYEPMYRGDIRYCSYTPMMTAFISINLMSIIVVVLCCTAAVLMAS